MTKAALSVVPVTLPAKYQPQPNISALAREFNVSRQTTRRWKRKGLLPPAALTIRILPQDQPLAMAGKGGRALSRLLVTVAVAIGILALVINGQFGHGLGTTPLAAMTFMGVAVAGDRPHLLSRAPRCFRSADGEPAIIFILHRVGHELHGPAFIVALDLQGFAVDLREMAHLILSAAGCTAFGLPASRY